MAIINLPLDQQRAISAVDIKSLEVVVEKCLIEERIGPIHSLCLSRCGDFVASRLQTFEHAIASYSKAKSYSKVEQTRADALRSGEDLVCAIQQMKSRVETEQKQDELFYVNDHIMAPGHFSKRLTVSVYYHWRSLESAKWIHGTTTFIYDSSSLPDYIQSLPKRKPCPATAEINEQDRLCREWDYLKMLALCSLRDFFRDGGDGNKIPRKFTVRPSPHGGGLNNFSCKFWQPME